MDPHFDGVIFATHAEELARRIKFEYPPFAVLDVRQDLVTQHRWGRYNLFRLILFIVPLSQAVCCQRTPPIIADV